MVNQKSIYLHEEKMSFVNENIPPETLKSFDFSVFRDELGGALDPEKKFIYTWTIDRERDAFLLWTGGGGGKHVGSPRKDWYALWWAGDIAQFSGERNVVKDEQGQVVTWHNVKLELSDRLASLRPQVINLLKEALDANELGKGGVRYHRALQLDLQ